jgi:hypothetical protein
LQRGDVIFAEKLRTLAETKVRTSKWKSVQENVTAGLSEDERILHFHTAVYLGHLDEQIARYLPTGIEYPKETPAIWHASVFSGATAVWSIEKFCTYYKPIAAKRMNFQNRERY